jgi:hypothetical protein
MSEDDVYNIVEKMPGLVEKEKDEKWNGFMARFARENAKIVPALFPHMNNGIAFIYMDKHFDEENVEKLKNFFNKRMEKVFKRIHSMGKKGIKSLFTKGSRWAVDTAFGTEEDMKVTEFSGVFPFADPTVIDYEDFEKALKTLEETSDLEVNFWNSEDRIISTLKVGGGSFSKTVADKMEESDYLSDIGRKSYGMIGCLSNYAWARRQMMSGIMEMAAKDAFGKSTNVKKIADLSFTIAFDDGECFVYRVNFPKTHNAHLSKSENGLTLSIKNTIYRMVSADE